MKTGNYLKILYTSMVMVAISLQLVTVAMAFPNVNQSSPEERQDANCDAGEFFNTNIAGGPGSRPSPQEQCIEGKRPLTRCPGNGQNGSPIGGIPSECCEPGYELRFISSDYHHSNAGKYCRKIEEEPQPEPEPLVECAPGPDEIRVLLSVFDIDFELDSATGNLESSSQNELRIRCVDGYRPHKPECFKYPGDFWANHDTTGCCNNGDTLTIGYPCTEGQLCPDVLPPTPRLGYCKPGEAIPEPIPVAKMPEGGPSEVPEIKIDDCIRFSWLFIPEKFDPLDDPLVLGASVDDYVGFFTDKCVLGALAVNWFLCEEMGFGLSTGRGKTAECIFMLTALESCMAFNAVDAIEDTKNEGILGFLEAALRLTFNTATGTIVTDAIEGDYNSSFTAPACLAGSVAFDKNCNVMTGDTTAADCDSIFVYSDLPTPVSLLWDGAQRLQEEPVARMFELETGKPQWVLWKASGKAPLLVSTPNGETAVTSATQLFGSSSFGKTFQNGFQALASLDKDGNGALQAEELKGISLWFDENRDAVSQPGEVKPLEEVGVTELFFNADRTDPDTSDMYASVGFTRKVGEKTESGVSVDWFSQGSANKQEVEKLIKNDIAFNQFTETRKRLLGQGKLTPPGHSKKRLDFVANAMRALQERDAKTGFTPSPVAGIWNWQIADKNIHPKFREKIAVGGAMLFIENPNGEIFGFVEHESPRMDSVGAPQKMVTKFPVTGKLTDKDRKEFRFTVDGPNEEGVVSKTENTVKLGDSDDFLNGASVTTKKFADGTTKEYRYSWTARRMKL